MKLGKTEEGKLERHARDAGLSYEETVSLQSILTQHHTDEAERLLRRRRATLLQDIHTTQDKLYCLDLLIRTISGKQQ